MVKRTLFGILILFAICAWSGSVRADEPCAKILCVEGYEPVTDANGCDHTCRPIPPNAECSSDPDCVHTGACGEICASTGVIGISCDCRDRCYAEASCVCAAQRCVFEQGRNLHECLRACEG